MTWHASKQVTSPPWNSRRLVHSKEMLWASRWSVALRTFYRQFLSLLYSSFFFWNFRPRLARELLVSRLWFYTQIHFVFLYHLFNLFFSLKGLFQKEFINESKNQWILKRQRCENERLNIGKYLQMFTSFQLMQIRLHTLHVQHLETLFVSKNRSTDRWKQEGFKHVSMILHVPLIPLVPLVPLCVFLLHSFEISRPVRLAWRFETVPYLVTSSCLVMSCRVPVRLERAVVPDLRGSVWELRAVQEPFNVFKFAKFH